MSLANRFHRELNLGLPRQRDALYQCALLAAQDEDSRFSLLGMIGSKIYHQQVLKNWAKCLAYLGIVQEPLHLPLGTHLGPHYIQSNPHWQTKVPKNTYNNIQPTSNN